MTMVIFTDSDGRVVLEVSQPTHEQEMTGIHVDAIPAPEERKGKHAVLYYDAVEGLYYEYIERPLTPEEKIELLENENADLWYNIMLKESRIDEHDNDIADIWYEFMTGGAA